MKSFRAFSLLEVLTVLSIILLLAALLTPVFISAKRSGLVTKSVSNLRQIYLSTEIYRGEYEGSNVGDAFQMGLPRGPLSESLPIFNKLIPPAAPHPNAGMVSSHYWYYFLNPDIDGLIPSWSNYTTKYESMSILYADPFFNPPSVPLDQGFLFERYVLGIQLDGAIRKKRARGDWMKRTWWHD